MAKILIEIIKYHRVKPLSLYNMHCQPWQKQATQCSLTLTQFFFKFNPHLVCNNSTQKKKLSISELFDPHWRQKKNTRTDSEHELWKKNTFKSKQARSNKSPSKHVGNSNISTRMESGSRLGTTFFSCSRCPSFVSIAEGCVLDLESYRCRRFRW